MNTVLSRWRAPLFALLAVCCAMAHAQAASPAPDMPSADAPSAAAASAASSAAAPDAEQGSDWNEHSHRHHHRESNSVGIGRDVDLPSGELADSVVAIFGTATSAGDARTVVSILGDSRVSGPVHDGAVSILGNTYIDSSIGGDVVAVLGNVELGPHADVHGDVVAVGGTVRHDPASTVRGSVQSVAGNIDGLNWLHPWIDHCLFYGRPLALVPGIDWAWGLALAFLALYVCIALLFRDGVARCVQTLETQPGLSVLAALLTVLLVPVLVVLLCITFIGIAAVPFLVIALFFAVVFGKIVMLAWLGGRVLKVRQGVPPSHPALAVLIGGVIVLALYVIPVIGFVTYKLLDLLGLGVVAYTLVSAGQARRAAARSNGRGQPGAPGAEPAPAAPPAWAGAPPSAGEGPSAGAMPFAAAAAASAAAASTTGAPPAGGAPPFAGVPPSGGVPPQPGAAAPNAPPPGIAPATPPITAALPRAGFWIRMIALLLDLILVAVLMDILGHAAHDTELLVLAVYGAVMWKLRGTTVGGIVFDLHVVRLDGRPIDWETAIVRAISCFLSLVVAGLGFFWIAFDDGKQAWHDKIAGTAVVRVKKGVPLV
jgi:uncharacterized RDD family membrane protein YckC